MSNSSLLKSSIAKKWWMALTGLFLCLFLVGHLLGNLQLIFITGEEGKRAFNEYAYFMTHNPFIKVLSWVTYLSILFHAVDGLMLAIQNKKARPQGYAYNKPGANTSLPSRYMAILGSAILIFIVIHMANFWGKMHFGGIPLHKTEKVSERTVMTEMGVQTVQDTSSFYYTVKGDYIPAAAFESMDGMQEAPLRIDGTTFIHNQNNLVYDEGLLDLHSVVMAFYGQDKSKDGAVANKYALVAVALYVLSMFVLMFHLWHGFASAFQSLGINHKRYNPIIKGFGKAFSVIIPMAFAIIPVIIFLNK